jgi:hypothetical protein
MDNDTTAELRRLARERDLCFFESKANHSEWQKRALFFYHCPKTGGMTIVHALQHALSCLTAVQSQELFLGRLDSLDPPPGTRVALPSAFVATHLPFGTHRKIAQDFDLMTVVRDPVARLTSGYTYACMRRGERPDPAGFRGFFTAPQNVNEMVRQLSGDEAAVGEESLEKAIENLRRQFVLYVTTRRIPDLIGAFLSRFRAPNVLMANANRTLPEYRIDAAPFETEIRRLNPLDEELYRFVRDNPKLDEIEQEGEAVSPMTLFVDEVERRAATLARAYHHKTALLPALLRSAPVALRQTTWA